MGGAWQPDPWGRFGFRWATELGWTEHVSDGTTIATDPPGPRAVAPMPAPGPAPIARQPVPPAATRARVPTAPAPAAGTEGRARRWGLVAAAVVLSFVLGAVVFGGGGGDGDGDESSEFVTAADTSTPEVASAGPVPPTVPPTAVPTTIVETTVPPTTAETVPATVPSMESPVGAGIASRNDLQIDDLEWLAIAETLVQEFAMEVPPRDIVTALATQVCEAARASTSAADWDAALEVIALGSGLPFGQFVMLMGASGVMMCVDDFVRLAPDQMPTF